MSQAAAEEGGESPTPFSVTPGEGDQDWNLGGLGFFLPPFPFPLVCKEGTEAMHRGGPGLLVGF